MRNLLSAIINNNLLFACVIIVLSAILVTLIILIIRSMRDGKKINIYEEELEDEDIKKVRKVKKEDIIDTPDNGEQVPKDKKKKVKTKEVTPEYEDITEEAIEERYDEENQKEIEEILEDNPSDEIEQLLHEMEESSKVKPEDVVANFEEEQEAQSIISYKELVDVVKNRRDEYYEDALESQPLTTVSDFVKEHENRNQVLDEKVEPETEEENKFQKTEIISPVFGRINEEKKEVKEKTSDTALSSLDSIYAQMEEDLKKQRQGENTLSKDQEFLQSLKDFRNKL